MFGDRPDPPLTPDEVRRVLAEPEIRTIKAQPCGKQLVRAFACFLDAARPEGSCAGLYMAFALCIDRASK